MLYCYTFFFFNDTATTEIYTLSLHDALPISFPVPVIDISVEPKTKEGVEKMTLGLQKLAGEDPSLRLKTDRSEEHTSELQSRQYLVCRLLLEKKKKT